MLQMRWTVPAGPVLFFAFAWLNPLQVPHAAAITLAMVVWMLWWWILEAVPMAVTALLPLIVFPLTGVLSTESTCLAYSNRFVFLFLGGFTIALAMEKWNVHRRLALSIVHRTGTNANRILFGFFLSAYLISMWISNTATTLMMLPIASSVVTLLTANHHPAGHKGVRNFSMSLMLSIAYGASIGGIATLVGSPPNASMAGILDKSFNYHVSFFEWMEWGLLFSFLLLITAYWIMVKWMYPNKLGRFALGQELISAELSSLGPWRPQEKGVMMLFVFTAVMWIFQDPMGQWLKSFGVEWTDTTIAIISACLLFILPLRSPLLEWKDTEKLPWGVLLMFGGGMALAEAFGKSGLVDHLTHWMSGIETGHRWPFMVLLCFMGLVLTALMSNIAMVNIFVPIVAALAVKDGLSPAVYAIPVTIAASCDFMFPMSTPPNAIAYSSGYIKSKDMLRTGLVLNVLALVLLSLLVAVMM